MAEVMAIFMALSLAEVGPQQRLEIKTDSQAAIGALEALQRKDPKYPWRSSPMAMLLEWGSIWFEEMWDRVKFTWVKGHAGNQYNTEADRLAGQAHGNEQRAWSLKVGAPPTVPYWACWKGQPAPGKPGSLIKRIERTVMDAHLLAQVRKANPQEQIELEDVKDTLAANAWFAAGNGKYESKNSFKKTTERDSTERSLGFKLLLGNVPVMKQQVAWYLLAYPELEMLRCPRDHPKEAPKEMREHFLECTWGDPELLPPQPGSAVAAWMDTYTQQTIPMVGISQRDRWNALEALHQDMHPHQRTM
ncbi:hypothetical protein GGI23_001615 [Coemansia sp. RSA 2559]|nr:hypothetical protein GGI23_001615 [Coemansia sp. RSA 2559]